MAQVKKLNLGGSIDPTLLNDELNKELSQLKLRSKDERKLRDALIQMRDYLAPSGGGTFTHDPVSNKYTITGQGSEIFAGSPDDITSNILTGNLQIKDDGDAYSVAAYLYNKAYSKLKNTKSSTTSVNAVPPKEKIKVGIDNFSDYARTKFYGNDENAKYVFSKFKTDEDGKAEAYKIAQSLIDNYKLDADKNKDFADYSDLNNITGLQTAIANKDWDAFLKESFKFGWSPQALLLPPGKEDELKQAAEAAAQQKTANTFTKTLINRGMSPEIAQKYANSGFYQIIDDMPWYLSGENRTADFYNYLKNRNSLLLGNASGQKILIDVNGQPLDVTGEEFDQFNPLYGSAWKNTEAGFTPIQAKSVFSDKRNIGKEILSEGFEPNTKIYGWSNNGNGDYLSKLELNVGGNKTIYERVSKNIYRNPINNQTIDVSGKLKGWGPSIMSIGYWDVPQEFSKIDSNDIFAPDIVQTKATEVINFLNGPGQIGGYTKRNITNVVKSLKYVVENTENERIKISALKQLNDISELLKRKNTVLFNKGGIIKAQAGTKFQEYQARYSKPHATIEGEVPSNTSKSADISNTFMGSTNLDKAILGLNAGMLLPGWAGVGSGLAATGLEAYRDATDADGWSWKDTGNLALNLGLTAGAFFGLGGLKAGSAAAKGSKLGKFIFGSENVVKTGKEALELEKAIKFANAEVKTSANALKEFATANNLPFTTGGLKSVIKEGHPLFSELQKMEGLLTQVTNSPKLLSNLTIIGKTNKLDTIGKVAVLGSTAGAVASGDIGSIINKIKNGNTDEIELDELQSLVSIGLGIKMGVQMGQSKIGKKYGMVPSSETKPNLSAEVNGKTEIIDDANIINKFTQQTNLKEKVKRVFKSNKLNSEVEKAFLDKVNAGLPIDNHIKADQIKKVKYNEGRTNGLRIREDGEYDFDKNLTLQNKGKKWAKKYALDKKYAGRPTTSETKIESVKEPVANKATEEVKAVEEVVKKFGKNLNINNLQKFQNKKREIKAAAKKSIEAINPESKQKTAQINKIKKRMAEDIKLLKDYTTFKSGGIFKHQSGTGSTGIKFREGLLNQLKNTIDPNTTANLLSFINTYKVNQNTDQEKAIEAGLVRLDGPSKQYLRIDRPNVLLGEKQAANIRSQARLIGNSTSDIDKAMAVQLEGIGKANEVISQGQTADLQRRDTLIGAQLENDASVNAGRLETSNKNKMLTAEAAKNLHLINLNRKLTNKTNFDNLMLTLSQTTTKNKIDNDKKIMYDALSNPKIKQHVDAYEDMLSNGRKTFEDAYNAEVYAVGANKHPAKTFEESQQYKDWQNKLKEHKDMLDQLYKPIEVMKLAMQYGQPLSKISLYKSGGLTLTKEDRLEIQRDKRAGEYEFKKAELLFKAIIHNNEMLQKSLIKVFK